MTFTEIYPDLVDGGIAQLGNIQYAVSNAPLDNRPVLWAKIGSLAPQTSVLNASDLLSDQWQIVKFGKSRAKIIDLSLALDETESPVADGAEKCHTNGCDNPGEVNHAGYCAECGNETAVGS